MAARAITSARLASVGFKKPVAARSTFAGKRVSILPAQARKVVVRAEETDVDKLVSDLSKKWDAVENKSAVAVYGAGAIAAIWLSSTMVGAINNVPLLPKMMELVGLGYTAWFTYRYLLFKSSREELIKDVEELKKKIAGSN